MSANMLMSFRSSMMGKTVRHKATSRGNVRMPARNTFVAQAFPNGSQSGSKKSTYRFPRYVLVRASEDEDPSMVELSSEDAPEPLGPLAMLLVGFTREEVDRVRNMMVMELEADMVKILAATPAMLKMRLCDVLDMSADQPIVPVLKRKTIILSGFYGEEIKDVIAAYTDEGLPDCIWAAVVENNYKRVLEGLVEDFNDEQSLMEARRAINNAD